MHDAYPAPLPLTGTRSIIVISDRLEWGDRQGAPDAPDDAASAFAPLADDEAACAVPVEGGYLERLPLALIAAGAYDRAEVWHHWVGDGPPPPTARMAGAAGTRLRHRAVPADAPSHPVASRAMLDRLATHGAPHLLVVYGLGVDAAILAACANSVIIYNSIDAPALRIPPDVSARCDLVLTGAEWQSDAVRQRHPAMATLVLPVGPAFAGTDQFRPLPGRKDTDLVYVAAAQDYKRHDILFDAMERLRDRGRPVSALLVIGYGELADQFARDTAARGLAVEIVGPPGVPFARVNELINRARIGIVAGIDDGAPAIITEYMLAGVPVLANEALTCGLQYLCPRTGRSASARDFADAIQAMLDDLSAFDPRPVALARAAWPVSVGQLVEQIVRLQR